MSELKGACIFGQSGGPTSVINASAYGVIATALKNPSITRVLVESGITTTAAGTSATTAGSTVKAANTADSANVFGNILAFL